MYIIYIFKICIMEHTKANGIVNPSSHSQWPLLFHLHPIGHYFKPIKTSFSFTCKYFSIPKTGFMKNTHRATYRYHCTYF